MLVDTKVEVAPGIFIISTVSDVKRLTAITEDGENVLLELMKEGASFRSSGVFTKHVLKRLAYKIRGDVS